jgi:iron complex transport system substrate-binding protein
MSPQRIVSLVPSATEIAFALGLGEQVVGVTFECDEPAHARAGREIVVGGLDTHGLDPAAIDALVRTKVAAGEQLYALSLESFRRCDPTLVLTQDLCRVCALPAGDADAAVAHLGCSADIVTLDPHDLSGVLDTVLAVGQAAGVSERAEALVASLRERLDRVAQLVAHRPRPRVFVLEWTDPPFAAGHWVPELVTAAGGEPVLAHPGQRSVPTIWEAIAEARPEVILVAPCGFDLDGAAAQAHGVMDRLPVGVPVWALDANGVVVRPGPRLVDGVETIAGILHPDADWPSDPDLAAARRL